MESIHQYGLVELCATLWLAISTTAIGWHSETRTHNPQINSLMLYLLSYTPIYIPNEFGPHLERTFLGGQVLTTTISSIRHFILLLNITQVYGGTYRT